MIKNNELRIGNWIYIGELIGQVNTDSFKTTEMFDPIPLTAEVLEKCGFDKHEGKWYKSFYRENDELLSQVFVGRLKEDPKDMYYYGFSSPIMSVNINNVYSLHQLQNIFFALTGTELTVNI